MVATIRSRSVSAEHAPNTTPAGSVPLATASSAGLDTAEVPADVEVSSTGYEFKSEKENVDPAIRKTNVNKNGMMKTRKKKKTTRMTIAGI